MKITKIKGYVLDVNATEARQLVATHDIPPAISWHYCPILQNHHWKLSCNPQNEVEKIAHLTANHNWKAQTIIGLQASEANANQVSRQSPH